MQENGPRGRWHRQSRVYAGIVAYYPPRPCIPILSDAVGGFKEPLAASSERLDGINADGRCELKGAKELLLVRGRWTSNRLDLSAILLVHRVPLFLSEWMANLDELCIHGKITCKNTR